MTDCFVSVTCKAFKLGFSGSLLVPGWWLMNHVLSVTSASQVCQFLQQRQLKLSVAQPNESRLQAEQCFTLFKRKMLTLATEHLSNTSFAFLGGL